MHWHVTPLGEKSIICVMFAQLLQLTPLIHALLNSLTVVGRKNKESFVHPTVVVFSLTQLQCDILMYTDTHHAELIAGRSRKNTKGCCDATENIRRSQNPNPSNPRRTLNKYYNKLVSVETTPAVLPFFDNPQVHFYLSTGCWYFTLLMLSSDTRSVTGSNTPPRLLGCVCVCVLAPVLTGQM